MPELPMTLEKASRIPGNASPHAKHALVNIAIPVGFGKSIGERLEFIEISVNRMKEDEVKMQARLVCEVVTSEDMLNGDGDIHGGCTSYLADLCTSLALFLLSTCSEGEARYGLSQALNIVCHGPAKLGDRLKIVSTTITTSDRVLAAQCEIWNVGHHRLVATGVHVTMYPSHNPKL